jgi:LmbE family N-acetylglucosaminyl deacetylase
MLDFHHPSAAVFIPDGLPLPGALDRTTHLGIGAHQDDLEFMACHGILTCFEKTGQWFTGVTCTDGRGSPRVGPYAQTTDEELARIRIGEQNTAATIGKYGAMIQLGYTSAEINDPGDSRPAEDLAAILRAARPEIVYTHNPADKHPTHLGVFVSVLTALRSLDADMRPSKVLGCEVWRGLDWLPDKEKVIMDVSGQDHLTTALNGVFASQIAGGKRYDLAVSGRRAANATFSNPHSSDKADAVLLGMDLTPLLEDDQLDPLTFTLDHIGRFAAEVRNALSARLAQ